MKSDCYLCQRKFSTRRTGRFYKHGHTEVAPDVCCPMSGREPMVVPPPGSHVNISCDYGPLFPNLQETKTGTYVGQIYGAGTEAHYTVAAQEVAYQGPGSRFSVDTYKLWPFGPWKITCTPG